jgi:NAD(P)-dependent dehydrogenase (short-subunit alcohol dehydrogenase family)
MNQLPKKDDISFINTTSIVTGGGSGIGAAMVKHLHDRGSKVTIVDIDEEAGRGLSADIGCDYAYLDVSDLTGWEELTADIADRNGSLDILCLNAGIGSRPRGHTVTDDPIPWIRDTYRNVINVNVDGVVYGVLAAIPFMEKQGSGAIVVTASVAGIRTQPPDPIYALSKSAVIGFVRSMAPSLTQRGISINALCPGSVDTPLQPEDRRLAGKEMSDPNEMAEATVQILESQSTGGIWIATSPDFPIWRYEFASSMDGPPTKLA